MSSSYIKKCKIITNSVQLLSPVQLFSKPFHHTFPEPTQTHTHRIGDATQPTHPHPSPPTFNLSQHQGLFHWVSSSHHVAKELEFQLQHQSFQWIFRTDLRLDLLAVQGTVQASSPTPQFKIIVSLALSFLYSPTLISIHDYWKNHSFD